MFDAALTCACTVALGLVFASQPSQPSRPSQSSQAAAFGALRMLGQVGQVQQVGQEGFGGTPLGESSAEPSSEPLDGAGFAPAAATSPEQQAIRRRIAQDRVRTRFLRREEASILGGFRKLETELKEKQRRQAKLIQDAKVSEVRVQDAERKLADLDAKLAALQQAVSRRVLAMHRLSKTKIGRLVDQISGRHGASRRRADWLRLVLAYDARLFDDARKTREEAAQSRAALAKGQATLEGAKSALVEETEGLLIVKEERAALLDAVRTERRAAERLSRELAEQARRLERESGIVRGTGLQPDAVTGGFGAQQGRLPWPLAGQVTVPFGKRVDPASTIVLFQKGIDVAAPLGAPVRAVFGGRVVHAALVHGFGKVVVIDHDGWFTVYAHLGTLRLSEGADVRQHEVLGFLGDDGRRRSVLHFEIRRGREPVDPQRWLSAG